MVYNTVFINVVKLKAIKRGFSGNIETARMKEAKNDYLTVVCCDMKDVLRNTQTQFYSIPDYVLFVLHHVTAFIIGFVFKRPVKSKIWKPHGLKTIFNTIHCMILNMTIFMVFHVSNIFLNVAMI